MYIVPCFRNACFQSQIYFFWFARCWFAFVANYKPTHNKKCPRMKRPISAKEKFFYYMSKKDLFRIIIIIIGDFDVGVSDLHMKNYCNAYNSSSLMKEPTCDKNLENPSCIDLILRSSPHSFQGSCVVETGQSDFHRMVVTIIKTTLQRLPAKIRTYRNNNKLYHHKFRETLVKELSSTNT